MTIGEGMRAEASQGELKDMKTMLQKILLKLEKLETRLIVVENRSHLRVGKGETSEGVDKRRDCIEMKRQIPQMEGLREEGSYCAYVDSFVSVLSQVGLSEEDQVALFVDGLKEDNTKLITILNPKTLQQAIAFGRVLSSDDDHYGSKGRTRDIVASLACPTSWCNAKLGGSSLGRKPSEKEEGRVETVLIEPNEEQEKVWRNIVREETEHMRLQKQKVGMEDFNKLTVIDKDAFEEARLCSAQNTKEIIAMNEVKKSEVLSCGQVEHVRPERNVLVEVDSQCIVHLYYSFQDSEFLYPIMEYPSEGDVITLLKKKDIQSEIVARLNIAERILVNQSIHQFDGFEVSKRIKGLISTNSIDALDQTPLSLGQLDMKIELLIPNEEFRLNVPEMHSRVMKLVRRIVWIMQGKGFEALFGYSPPIHIYYTHGTTITSEIETILDKVNFILEETGAELGSESVGSFYSCVVSYSSTTTRCSRCKALGYCYEKCHIVHWKQSHREECYPPKEYVDRRGNISRSYVKVCTDGIVEHPKENPCDEMGRLTNQEGLTKSNSSHIWVDEEGKFMEPPARSPFSGFSSSITNSESSDDLLVCKSVNSDDSGKSSVPSPAVVPHQASQTAHYARLENKDDRCSPKSSMLVDAVGGFKDREKLGDGKKINDGHIISGLNRESSLHKNGMGKATFSTSNFWSPNLYSDEQTKRMHDRSSNISPGSAPDSAMSDSKSILRFSFSLSENATRTFHRQDHKDSTTNMPDNLDKKIKCGNSGGTMLMRNKSPRSANVKGLGGLHNSRSRGTESRFSTLCDADASSSSQPFSLTTGNNIVSEKPKFRESGYTASTTVSHTSPNVQRSDSRLKPGKASNGHKRTDVSSQVVGSLPSAKNGLRTSVWRVLDQLKGSVLAKHHQAGVGSDVSERGNVKALLPCESFAKLYYQKGLVLRPCGLGLHSEACSRSDWCFTREFERLILKFKEGKSHVSPIENVSHLRNIGRQLGNGSFILTYKPSSSSAPLRTRVLSRGGY